MGTGNSINKQTEPVDDADLHALIHDLEYELASSKNDIRRAGEEAILNFIEERW